MKFFDWFRNPLEVEREDPLEIGAAYHPVDPFATHQAVILDLKGGYVQYLIEEGSLKISLPESMFRCSYPTRVHPRSNH